MSNVEDRRVAVHGAIERGPAVSVTVDGAPLAAYQGETLAAAMLAGGRRVFRGYAHRQPARPVLRHGRLLRLPDGGGGAAERAACMTPVADGMRAETQRGPAEGAEPVPAP